MANWWTAFDWGSYGRKTDDLSALEHGVYFLLLKHYYSTGSPIPANAARLLTICRAFDDPTKAAMTHILDTFFTLDGDVYRNQRCDEEIEKTSQVSEKRRLAGKLGADVTNGKRVGKDVGKRSANADTITITTTITDKVKDSCGEPSGSPLPIAGTLPLNDGSEHQITKADESQWKELYPAVDVRQELRNMKGWLLANPVRRKTKSGIKKFINNWLAKAQDGAKVLPVAKSKGISLDELYEVKSEQTGVH